jgi:hypothetical protein
MIGHPSQHVEGMADRFPQGGHDNHSLRERPGLFRRVRMPP